MTTINPDAMSPEQQAALRTAGRRRAGLRLAALQKGWPEITTTPRKAFMWRRFNEPGMEIKYRTVMRRQP